MPTYGQELKDKDGNTLLPKTRSTLVYCDDESTVEAKIKSLEDRANNANVVNTEDSNATAANLTNGATAYVKGQKVTGNNPSLVDTTDSNATAANLTNGASAFVKGQKVTGNNPSLVNTAGTNCENWAMLNGRSAFVNGAKVNGTMPILTGDANRNLASSGFVDGYGSVLINIPAGHYTNFDRAYTNFPGLKAQNIRNGINIGGVVGTLKPGAICLGHSTSFNCQSLPNWQSLTVGNFAIEGDAHGVIKANSHNSQSFFDDFQNGQSEAQLAKVKSYDASSGILTAYYVLYTRSFCAGGGAGSWGNWVTANIPVWAYFIG